MDTVTGVFIEYEIKRQKVIKQDLDCKFVRTDPDKDDIFRAINKISRHIKHSTKKALLNKISTILLGLEFKSDKLMKSKATKFIAIKIFADYKQQRKLIGVSFKSIMQTKNQLSQKVNKTD